MEWDALLFAGMSLQVYMNSRKYPLQFNPQKIAHVVLYTLAGLSAEYTSKHHQTVKARNFKASVFKLTAKYLCSTSFSALLLFGHYVISYHAGEGWGLRNCGDWPI